MTSLKCDLSSIPSHEYIHFGDGIPFGQSVVDVIASQEIGSADDREVLKAQRNLRAALRTFMKSDDPDDQESVVLMRQHFQEDALVQPGVGPYWGNVLKRIDRVSVQEFIEFCKWNVDFYATRQADLDAALPGIQEQAINSFEHLQGAGILSGEVVLRYEETIRRVGRITALDSFDVGGTYADGLCTADGEVLMSGLLFSRDMDLRDDRKQGHQVAFHEYTHAYGAYHDAGFAFGKASSILLEEALVGHITSVAHDPRPQQAEMDPMARVSSHIGTYGSERELVAIVTQYALQPIGAEELIGAFHEPDRKGDRWRRDIMRRLSCNARETWPMYNSWSDLTAEYSKLPRRDRSDHLARLIFAGFEQLGYEVEVGSSDIMDLPAVELAASGIAE